MDENRRPRSREKYVTQATGKVERRGSGSGYSASANSNQSSHTPAGTSLLGLMLSRGGGMTLIILVIGVVLFLKFGMSHGGSDNSSSPVAALFGSSSLYTTNNSGTLANMSDVDKTVASSSRSKYTTIKGSNQDVITIMLYVCGTDLESKHGMATSDLKEIQDATIGTNLNIIAYTGGCKNWKNNIISSSYNQIYQIKSGQIKALETNAGYDAMTKPSTLSGFIKYCASNFPANRYALIFWDHGGGSITGFGYDEKNASAGSMNLAGINTALKDGGVKFDFIGFDACLMATTETALMLSRYADYMIASEEEEPGTGWYYTNWVSKLSANTSIPTIDLGKIIIDDYTSACAAASRTPKTTLSIVDLAEFSNTVPSKLTAFAESITDKISDNDYKEISDARVTTREFSPSSKIDQVDLIDLSNNLNTDEAKALANALKGSIKYNRVSNSMTNCYGLSIYFPYRRASKVDNICMQYDQIGMNSEYSKCIKAFAKIECAGQAATGGATSPYDTLSGNTSAAGLFTDLLTGFLSGDFRSMPDFDSQNTDFLSESTVSDDAVTSFVKNNYLDESKLRFTKSGDQYMISLSEDQWKLVHTIDQNVFYDDGSGYIDLGLDNLFTIDKDGNMIADTDRTWIAINGQPVCYYHLDTVDDGTSYTITGRVPVLLNGNKADLILIFTDKYPQGYIAGARDTYKESETLAVAKNLTELKDGDKIDFLCNYYSYDGKTKESCPLGNQLVYSKDMKISNVDIGSNKILITYMFTDIYNQRHWTDTIKMD